MILNIYGGNLDWPNNNWSATRKREAGAGYRFFAWDAERTLEDPALNRVELTGSNNPAEFYAALRQNAEFRLLFADRVHRHFFHGGALTPAAAAARYTTRAAKVETGIFAEHASWGAYRSQTFDRPCRRRPLCIKRQRYCERRKADTDGQQTFIDQPHRRAPHGSAPE